MLADIIGQRSVHHDGHDNEIPFIELKAQTPRDIAKLTELAGEFTGPNGTLTLKHIENCEVTGMPGARFALIHEPPRKVERAKGGGEGGDKGKGG